MRAFEFLIEGGLSRLDFYRQERIQNFIDKMNSGKPFKKIDGTEVVLKKDPMLLAILSKEAPDVDKSNLPSIPTQLFDINGNIVKLSSLEKTVEFGSTEKEKFPVKPSDLPSLSGEGPKSKLDISNPSIIKDILDKQAFPAGQLGDRIINDPVLKTQAGKLGTVIIDMTNQIMLGNVPEVPKDLNDAEKAALRDYAGEYLGLLQVINGLADFPNSGPFFEHLGTDDLKSLKLFFPKATSTPLADSIGVADSGIAAVQSPTGTVMKISSKGDKIGAPPSLDNLDPQVVQNEKWAKEIVDFINIAKSSLGAEQPFRLINYLHNINPKTIDSEISQVLPLTDQDITDIINAKKTKSLNKKVQYLTNLAGNVKGTDFGKCHYAVNKSVISAVNNSNALPNLKKAVLEILGSNFVQIYTIIKSNKLMTSVLWPNRISGEVFLYSKASAADPGKAKLSFYVSK